MLYLHFGTTKETLFRSSEYFDWNFQSEWLENPLVKEIISDIDKSTVIGGRVIDSPVLVMITPRELAGGTKVLILILFEDGDYYWSSDMGDNCCKWILRISEIKDVHLSLIHMMLFPEDFSTPMTFVDVDNLVVDNYDKYIDVLGDNWDRLTDIEEGVIL
ncbi:hypothetical protein AGMMS49975_20120 [Clostridia bacterium]|nr:hypothetical protein AGMMS49975_20120 [Clostridia bacterium]